MAPYPAAPPVVDGINITVQAFLRDPARVQRVLENMALQRFVTDVIFATGPTATGGAVLFDRLDENDLYLDGDVQSIEPGGEFPLLDDTEKAPLVAAVRKWGAEVFITDEAVRRDRRDVVRRKMSKLRNNIIRRVDGVSMATLAAAPLLTGPAAAAWAGASGNQMLNDILTGANAVNARDLGYVTDTVLINPAQELQLLTDADIRGLLPRERDDSIIRTGNLGRLVGHDFIVSNRVPAGTVYIVQRGTIGSVSDEVPLYSKVIPDERRERAYVHGARIVVPYVTDPLAGYRLTGV